MPEGEIYIDRRKHKRVDKKLKVIYKIMPKESIEGGDGETVKKHVNSEDISVSGIQLICDDDLPIDSVVRLDIMLEDNSSLATFAEVRWARRDSRLEKYRIGMEFLVIKEDHISAIKQLTGEL